MVCWSRLPSWASLTRRAYHAYPLSLIVPPVKLVLFVLRTPQFHPPSMLSLPPPQAYVLRPSTLLSPSPGHASLTFIVCQSCLLSLWASSPYKLNPREKYCLYGTVHKSFLGNMASPFGQISANDFWGVDKLFLSGQSQLYVTSLSDTRSAISIFKRQSESKTWIEA